MTGRSVLGVLGFAILGVTACGGPGITSFDVTPVPTTTGPKGPSSRTPSTAPLFGGTVTRASRAYPISGGTLLVTRDGSTAVAADPDRGRVFLADLATHVVRSVATGDDDEVGRAVEGEPGQVYVVARRGGAVLAIDVASATLVRRVPVCNAPRGIAYDGSTRQLHVACASGALVSIAAETGAVVRKVTLDDDLRDVVVRGGGILVSRFRSAEILSLDANGSLLTRARPTNMNSARPGPATLAYRTMAAPDGTMFVVHQQSSSTTLGSGLGAYYGADCGGSVTDTFISKVTAFETPADSSLFFESNGLNGATGPLDIAVSGDGNRIAVVATGNSWAVDAQHPKLAILPGSSGGSVSGCWNKGGTDLTEGEAVAVAFDANGKYVVQYREPAKLVLETTDLVREISLSTESRADTGLALFHVNPGGGVACVSCHPEAGMDGHVWSFSQFGLRVTQPLEGQISKRAPFHWAGDLPDWSSLIGEVMMKRMAMPTPPSEAQSRALLDWLDSVPRLAPADDLVPESIERGRALFEDATVGCATCHSGAMFTDNRLHDVGTGGTFIAPSLVGVGARAPLMHDGCAATVRSRFYDCGGGDNHGRTSHLSSTQVDDLVAFLRSL